MSDKEHIEPPAEEQPKPAEVEPTDMVDKANEAAARLEKATDNLNKTLEKQEALSVKAALGGETVAGQEKKEESPEDYAKKVMANELETKDT